MPSRTRAEPTPRLATTTVAIRGGGKREGGARGLPRFLAATHYFLVVAFDVDGLGHSKRLIENFLRLENGARNVIGGRIAVLYPELYPGVEKEESIYLTCRTV